MSSVIAMKICQKKTRASFLVPSLEGKFKSAIRKVGWSNIFLLCYRVSLVIYNPVELLKVRA